MRDPGNCMHECMFQQSGTFTCGGEILFDPVDPEIDC